MQFIHKHRGDRCRAVRQASLGMTAWPPRPPFAMAGTAGLLALAFACPAQAIMINDRVAGAAGGVANYWDRDGLMPSVVSLYTPGFRTSQCTGTLINARTILTAAHCIGDTGHVAPHLLSLHEIRFGADPSQVSEHDRKIIGARVHEFYAGNATAPDGTVWESRGGDIALVTLSAPVSGVQPIRPLRAGETGPMPGAVLDVAGYGNASNGSGTERLADSKRRVAQTVLGFYGRIFAEDQAPVYGATFRNPDAPEVADLFGVHQMGVPVPARQGGPESGDSGGPLFWTRADGSRVQVGIVIGTFPGLHPTFYGSNAMWTSVSAYSAWIDTHNPLRQVMASGGEQRWSDASIWRDAMGRHESPDNRNGNDRGLGDTGRFYQVGLAAAGRMTLDIDPTIDTLAVLGAKATLALPAGRKLKVIDQAALARGGLELNGRLETMRFDMSGGLLGGVGTLATSHGATVTGGVIAPGGTDIGTLSVTGNYTHGGDAVLAVGARDGVSDRLAVSGNVTLNGGTLAVLSGKGVYRTDIDYDVLTAAAVQGRFGAVRSDLAFLAPTLANGPASVRLTLMRNGTSFASVADPNHSGIAASADRLGQGNALYRALSSSNAAQARQAFGHLSGESLASTTSHVIDHTRALREAAVTRLRDGAAPADAASGGSAGDAGNGERGGAWVQTFGTWGRMAAGAGTASVDSSMQGLMGGMEHAFSASTRAGIATSFARGAVSVAERAGTSSVESYEVLLHASHWRGAWRLRGGGGVGMSDVVSQRTPSMPGFSDKTSARYRVPVMQGFGEAGYAMRFGAAQVEPFFNLAHVRTRVTDFAESGGAAALRGRIEAHHVTLTTTGVRANWTLEDSSRGQWSVGSMLGWRHALRNSAPKATTGFVAGGGNGTVRGAALSSNRLALQLDVARSVGVDSQLGLSYGGEWAPHAQDHMLRATWRQRF